MDIPDMGVPADLAARMSMAEQHEYLRSKFSRRGLIRGGVVAAGAAATAPFLAGTADAAQASPGATAAAAAAAGNAPAFYGRPGSGAVNGALVAPYGRHLAFGADPSSQFRIAWQTPVAVNRPFLRFGRSPLELGHRIAAETRALHTPALSPPREPKAAVGRSGRRLHPAMITAVVTSGRSGSRRRRTGTSRCSAGRRCRRGWWAWAR